MIVKYPVEELEKATNTPEPRNIVINGDEILVFTEDDYVRI